MLYRLWRLVKLISNLGLNKIDLTWLVWPKLWVVTHFKASKPMATSVKVCICICMCIEVYRVMTCLWWAPAFVTYWYGVLIRWNGVYGNAPQGVLITKKCPELADLFASLNPLWPTLLSLRGCSGLKRLGWRCCYRMKLDDLRNPLVPTKSHSIVGQEAK